MNLKEKRETMYRVECVTACQVHIPETHIRCKQNMRHPSITEAITTALYSKSESMNFLGKGFEVGWSV